VVHNLFATQKKLADFIQRGVDLLDTLNWDIARALSGRSTPITRLWSVCWRPGPFLRTSETFWLVQLKFAADQLWGRIDSVGPAPVRTWAARIALGGMIGPLDTLKTIVLLQTDQMNVKMKATTRLIDIQALIDKLMHGPAPPGMTVDQVAGIGADLRRLEAQRELLWPP